MKKFIILTSIIFLANISAAFAFDIESRFGSKTQLRYKVYFNGISSGLLLWNYLGKETLDTASVDVLEVISNTRILKLLNVNGNDRVYLDSNTFLPLKVVRDLLVFGNKEVIEELYDQKNGSVTITKTTKKEISTEKIRRPGPIHNILALLYFFPEDVELINGKKFFFTLPTQKLVITALGEKNIETKDGKVPVYFLTGHGAKRFNLWIDKETRVPIRLEFMVPLGKVVFVKQ